LKAGCIAKVANIFPRNWNLSNGLLLSILCDTYTAKDAINAISTGICVITSSHYCSRITQFEIVFFRIDPDLSNIYMHIMIKQCRIIWAWINNWLCLHYYKFDKLMNTSRHAESMTISIMLSILPSIIHNERKRIVIFQASHRSRADASQLT